MSKLFCFLCNKDSKNLDCLTKQLFYYHDKKFQSYKCEILKTSTDWSQEIIKRVETHQKPNFGQKHALNLSEEILGSKRVCYAIESLPPESEIAVCPSTSEEMPNGSTNVVCPVRSEDMSHISVSIDPVEVVLCACEKVDKADCPVSSDEIQEKPESNTDSFVDSPNFQDTLQAMTIDDILPDNYKYKVIPDVFQLAQAAIMELINKNKTSFNSISKHLDRVKSP